MWTWNLVFQSIWYMYVMLKLNCFTSSEDPSLCGLQCQRQYGIFFFTLSAWWCPSQTLETGTATSTDTWRERVCMNNNKWAVSTGVEMHRFVSMCIHVMFCCFSGVWILVLPCEQLVEEDTDLLTTPLHVLRRHDRGVIVVFVGSFYRVNSLLAGIIQWW